MDWFKKIVFYLGVLSFLGVITLLVLLWINPRFSENVPLENTGLKVYLDNSRSMAVYENTVVDQYLKELSELWDEAVEVIPFTEGVFQAPVLIDELNRIHYLGELTWFDSIKDKLLFFNRTEDKVILSDFISSDGVSFKKGKETNNLLRFNLAKESEYQYVPKSAGIILNRDESFIPNEPYDLKLLFYNRKTNVVLNYEVFKLTDRMGDKEKKIKGKKILSRSIKMNENYEEVGHSFKIANVDWASIRVEVKRSGENGLVVGDGINLYPNYEKIPVQFLFFKPSKEGLALKTSLERYQFVDTAQKNLFRPKQKNIKPIEMTKVLKRLGNSKEKTLFFLVSPPVEWVRYFRKNRLAFIHLADFSGRGVEQTGKNLLKVENFDYHKSFVNFLGDKKESEKHWASALSDLTVYPLIDVVNLANKEVEVYDGQPRSASGFFRAGKEVYLGFKGIYRLNAQLLTSSDESYLDLFVVRLIQDFWKRVGGKKQLFTYNFYLGEKVSQGGRADLMDKLPYLKKFTVVKNERIDKIKPVGNKVGNKISDGGNTTNLASEVESEMVSETVEIKYVTPSVLRAGSYQNPHSSLSEFKQINLPPLHYRIDYREYLPPANYDFKAVSDEIGRWENIKSQLSLMQENRVTTKVVEIGLRNYLPIYMWLLFLFVLFLVSKWYYFK